MTRRITVRVPASPGASFSDGMFDSSVGKNMPIKTENCRHDSCTLISYEILERGAAALMTFSVR